MYRFSTRFVLSAALLIICCCSNDKPLQPNNQNESESAKVEPESAKGTIVFKVTWPSKGYVAKIADIEEVSSITAYVNSGAGGTEITHADLQHEGNRGKAEISVEAGNDFQVVLVAFDSDKIKYIGSDDDVDVVAGGTATADIIMANAAPTLNSAESTGENAYSLTWSSSLFATSYTLEEDDNNSFSSPTTVYSGSNATMSFSNKTGGKYYYRVSSVTDYGNTLWSDIQSVEVGANGTIIIDIPWPDETSPGITFVSIPGGQFPMGDTEGVGEADEIPVHAVTLSPFEMSAYEITTKQYVQFLNDALKTGYITFSDLMSVKGAKGEYSGEEYVNLYYTSGNNYNITYLDGVFFVVSGFEMRPMVHVTWYGAKAFALYYDADLPTEAEWEYACRGKKQYKYGTDDGTLSTTKAYYSPSISKSYPPVDVGKYPANPLGLYDMSGNVWEFCNDWYGSYSSEGVSNPTGNQTESNRVIRGGGSNSLENKASLELRSAKRNSSEPGIRNYYLGFRVVRRPGGVTY